MPEPYLKRADGDLISANDWNELQVQTRAEIAAAKAKIEAVDAKIESLPARVETVVVESRLKAGDVVWKRPSGYGDLSATAVMTQSRYRALRCDAGPGYACAETVNATLATSDGERSQLAALAWNTLLAPSLTVTTTRSCLLRLQAGFGLLPKNDYAYWNGGGWNDLTRSTGHVTSNQHHPDLFQFMVGDGANLVPVRSSGLLGATAPTASTLSDWIAAHTKCRKDNGYLPIAAQSSYVPPGYITPHLIEETLEVPAGTWLIRLGSFSFSTLYDLVLRAIVLPLGERA